MTKSVRLVIILILICGILTPSVYAYSVTLSVPSERQSESNWCWAATSVAVAYYRNKTYFSAPGYTSLFITQRNHVYVARGDYANEPRDFYAIKFDFERLYNIYSTVIERSFTVSEIKSHLNAGKPIYIRIAWNVKEGHAILITGAHDYGGDYLEIMDPATGSKVWYTYNTVKNSYPSNGTWSHTLYNL